jgi:hypothetical protein
VATATLSLPLQFGRVYKIRVRGTVTNAAGVAMGADFTQPLGFTARATCPSDLVISQVFGASGGAGAAASADFIELHNVGAAPISLAGFALQISAATSTTWTAQSLPAVTVPAGGYFLVQQAIGGGAPLANADFVPTNPVDLVAARGKVALTPTTAPLAGGCPALAGMMDLVGYGANVSCSEGSAAPAPGTATGALRKDNGCADIDDNATDFAVGAAAPRGASSPPRTCACAVP